METPHFRAGDRVRAKGVRPAMVVQLYDRQADCYRCVWTQGGAVKRGDFDAAELEPLAPHAGGSTMGRSATKGGDWDRLEEALHRLSAHDGAVAEALAVLRQKPHIRTSDIRAIERLVASAVAARASAPRPRGQAVTSKEP